MAIMVKLNHNWADEFDVKGVQFWESEDDYKAWRAEVAAGITSGELTSWGFGTNQEIEFEDAEDFLRGLRETEITQEEFNTTVDIWVRSGTHPHHYGFSFADSLRETFGPNGGRSGHRVIHFGNNPI